MNEIITEILRWATAICFIYVGYIVCISLRVPPEYRTNDKK
jgi:hypothetical protein